MASTNAFAGKNSKEKCVKVRLTVRVLNFLLPKAVDDFWKKPVYSPLFPSAEYCVLEYNKLKISHHLWLKFYFVFVLILFTIVLYFRKKNMFLESL